jgi:hypothetical protein
MKKIVISVAVLLCLSSALFAEDKNMAPLSYSSTASNALGGPHVAYTDNIYSLFVNPAALQWANESMIFDLTFSFIGPFDKLLKNKDNIKGIMNAMGDDDSGAMGDSFSALTDIVEGGKLPIGFDIRGPFSFGYTANGLGLGLFSRIFVDTRIIGTSIDVNAYVDLTLPFGMSFNILKLKDHELSTGFVLKPFARVWVNKEMDALEFLGDADFNLDIPVIAGLANDLGFMYRFKKDLVAGLTISDVYTFGFQATNLGSSLFGDTENSDSSNVGYRVPIGINPGIAYTFRPSSFWTVPKVLQSFYTAVMFDWANVQHAFTWNNREHRNPLLDMGLGLEVGLFSFLKFRAGVHELLPAIGFGLEPSVFKLNFAIYGKELGSEPGVNSTLGADLSITFRPDTKKRNWVWTQPMVK